MFTTQLNLPAADRAQLADLLNQQLADLSDLSAQTKQAHWNVRGRHFYQQHKLFEELAAAVDEQLDELAERIVTLGGYARGTVRDAAAATRLDDFPREQTDDLGYVEVLGARFAACANQVRLAIGAADELDDATTADLLTQISRMLDQSLWFLEAHLRAYVEPDTSRDAGADGAAHPDADSPAPASSRPRARTPGRAPARATTGRKSR